MEEEARKVFPQIASWQKEAIFLPLLLLPSHSPEEGGGGGGGKGTAATIFLFPLLLFLFHLWPSLFGNSPFGGPKELLLFFLLPSRVT